MQPELNPGLGDEQKRQQSRKYFIEKKDFTMRNRGGGVKNDQKSVYTRYNFQK